MDKLTEFKETFNEISSMPKWSRDYRLAELMTDMERAFKIPMFQSESYDKANPEVIRLYRTISLKRSV